MNYSLHAFKYWFTVFSDFYNHFKNDIYNLNLQTMTILTVMQITKIILIIIKITIVVLAMLIITKWSEIGGWLRVVADGFEWFAVLVTSLQQTYRDIWTDFDKYLLLFLCFPSKRNKHTLTFSKKCYHVHKQRA